ncbi:MAG: NAD+ synthase [Acidimicrobiales bacterium]
MSSLRVALCQVDAVVGDFEHNVRLVLERLEQAETLDADLALFPELCLTGYPPEDLILEPAFVRASEDAFERVASESGRCAAIVGYVTHDGGLRNAAGVVAHGEVFGSAYKQCLPNYGVFDEARWFTPGRGDTPLFVIGGVPIGVVICEDAWEPAPIGELAQRGATLITVSNASPYRVGARTERLVVLRARAAESHRPIAYVNLVGGQDELIFDGGSVVIDHGGEIVASAPQFREGVVAVDLELEEELIAGAGSVLVTETPATRRSIAPPARNEPLDPDAEVYAALVLATRDYVEKNRFRDVVVGMSGGIDSSLVATIAADAIGARHVHGVSMPSRFSSEGSRTDAEAVAANLGIDYRLIEIEPVHAAFLDVLAPSFFGRGEDITEENLQARIRGTLLMALSNKFGWLVLTTGNKSETAVGYSTLYGDTAGGFAVIRDVPKTLVYALANRRNKVAGAMLIPESVLSKPPSAELKPDQRDDDFLPPYEVLDPILEAYVEHNRTVGNLVADGYDAALVRRVFRLVDQSEYKRRQAPLGPRVTSRGFGRDRRMPITNHFLDDLESTRT